MVKPREETPSGQQGYWVAAFAAAAMLLGLTALAGWIWNVEALKSVIPGLIAMKANTAMAFVLVSASLWLLTAGGAHGILRQAGIGMAGFVLLFCLLTLGEDVFGWDLRIDQLIFQEPAGTAFTIHPGRMSWVTAVQFSLLGGALMLLHLRRAFSSARVLAMAAGMMALLMIGRYMVGNPGLLVGRATPPALNTALGFLMLASGVIAATANRDFLARIRRHIPMIGMGAAIILVLIAISASFFNILRMRESFGWVEHTQEVQLHLKTTQSLISHVGEHVRGFLLSHDEEFLASVMEDREKVSQEMPVLQELTRDNPAMQEHLAALRQLIASRMEKVDEGLRIYREKGDDLAITQLISGPIKHLASDIEVRIADMNLIMEEVFIQRQAAADTATNSSLTISGIMGLLGICMMAMMVMFGRRLNAVLEQMVSKRTAELSERNRDLRLLSDCNQTLIRATDEMALLQAICDLIVNQGGYKLCWIGYTMKDDVKSIRPAAQAGFDKDTPQGLPIDWADNEAEHGPTGTAICTRSPGVCQNIANDPACAHMRTDAIKHGYNSSAALPLLANGSVMGVINIYATSSGSFDAWELALLAEMANDLAFGISTLRDRAALCKANRAKAEFLAHMSHELRTPLNAIMGFSEVIADEIFGPQSPKYPEYAKDIHSSSEHLLSLINDVLDLSKIEGGKLCLSRKSADTARIIGECADIVGIMASAKKIEIILDVVPGLPSVNVDIRALRQVLFNLLSNAIKFTPGGGRIEIMARATENPPAIHIDIHDTGIGIAPEMLDKVFEPFGQGDSTVTPAFGGMGLGLSISRNLVEMHGGTLTLESKPGRGTTVHMTLPV